MLDSLNTGIRGVLPNNSFLLAIGKELLSFAKVNNISRTLDFDTFVEGGLNTMVRSFVKPKQQQETLVLEKGVNISRDKDIDVYTRLGLRAGGRIKQAVTLVVLGDEEKEDRYYSFNEGVVIKWQVGNLDAMGGEVLIESFEIAHSGLEELKQTTVDYM
jgi:phage tail-like protein